MTFFSRQPSRLLNRLIAAKPRFSAVSFLRRNVANNARNGPSKPQASVKPAASNAPVPTAYPRRLLIFHSPTLETTTVATAKLVCVGFFAMGCLVAAPNAYLDENTSIWMVPAVIAVSAAPLPLIHAMTRPFITNIFIETPAWARRSREALVRFAERLPLDTPLEIETLGFLPWPRRKALRVSDLRTIPESFGRLANLEQITTVGATSKVPRALRWPLTQFYARPSPSRWEKSRAPDVWPLVLQAIARNSVAGPSKKLVAPTLAARAVHPAGGVQKKMPAAPTPRLRNQQGVRKK